MAVTKRMRYEVLRRDDYTCRYCGASAPDVKLAVDHVVPVALGGADHPSNLVAACGACNSGKTSVPADAALVESVEDDAFRWAAAMRKAAEAAYGDLQERQRYRDAFRMAWESMANDGTAPRLPFGWERSLDSFRAAGLPDWELREAVVAVAARRSLKPEDAFRYFCGVCWTKVRALQDRAAALIGDGGQRPSIRALTVRAASEVAFEAWQKVRLETGASSLPALNASVLRQLQALEAEGFTEEELTRAAQHAAKRRIPTIALSLGHGMDVKDATIAYDRAASMLCNGVASLADADEDTVAAFVYVVTGSIESLSRAFDTVAHVAVSGVQARALRAASRAVMGTAQHLEDITPNEEKASAWISGRTEWPA